MNTSVKTLIGFLLLLTVALVYAFIHWPRQARVTSVPDSGISAGVSARPGALPSVADVSQEARTQDENEALVSRNIFAPLFRPPVQASVPDIQENQMESAPVLPAEILPPPRPIPIFLGKLRHAGQVKVFLSVAGEVYVVGPGDTFGPDSAYRLIEISSQNLTIKHNEDKDNFQIDAAEQPISVLSSSGTSYGEVMPPDEPTEIDVPIESGSSDKEVPIDKVVNE